MIQKPFAGHRKGLNYLSVIVGTIKVVLPTSHLQACSKVLHRTLTIDTWDPLSPLATQHVRDMADLLGHLLDRQINNSLDHQQGILVSKNITVKIR
jgi:hypothetical protein